MSFIHNFFSSIRRRFSHSKNLTPTTATENIEPGINSEKRLLLTVKKPGVFPSFSQLISLPRIIKPWERLTLTGAFFIFLIAVGWLAISFVITHRTLVPTSGGTFTEAVVGQPQFINPLWANANNVDRDLTHLMFAGLFKYSTKLELEPDLAESYEISTDGKTYTVHLRPNLTWSDGEPLTASDVVFTIQSIQNPAYHSSRILDFRNVSISSPDAYTVVFVLNTSFTPFLHALTVGIIPEHLWSDVPPEHARLAELNIKPVGAGVLRFKNLKKTKQGELYSYALEPNPHYHETKPYLKTMLFRFFPDYQTATEALTAGNADGLAFIPRDLRSSLIKPSQFTSSPIVLPQITAVFFNQKKNPLLTEKDVREALVRAVNPTNVISDAFGSEATPISGPILPEALGYTNDVTQHPFDLSAARQLLDQTGFVLKEGNTIRTFVPKTKSDKRFSPNTELKLSLATVNVPEYARAAELIAQAWREIGVNVTVTSIEPQSLERDVIPNRNFDALLYGEILGAETDPYPFWDSSQIAAPGVNLAGYANKRVDALLEEARTLPDPAERTKRYIEFQKIIATDLPALFLLSPTYTYTVSRAVHGVSIDKLIDPADRFNGIAKWYLKSRNKLW